MIDLIRSRVGIVLFVLLCGSGAMFSIWQVRDWGNDLSLVDPYSEANVLREARHFREDGLTRHYGLGTVLYPGMYSSAGFATESDVSKYGVSPEGVYTHYPPGPEYLLYAATKLLGPEPVSRLRLLPIAIGWAAVVYFSLALRRRFGAAIGWMVAGACIATPTVTDGFVGVHSQGYALALLMIEIAIAIGTKPVLAPFAVLGFLQGWLSFDYVFLVTLTPVTIELVMPTLLEHYRRRWKMTWWRVILAGIGFSAAHALHFLQVVEYRGSFAGALDDFAGSAAYRAGAGMVGGPIGYIAQVLSNLKLYLYGLHPFNPFINLPASENYVDWSTFRFLGLTLGPWWLVIAGTLIIWDYLKPSACVDSLRRNWHIVCFAGLVTSSLWSVVMVNHGMVHRHFLYRHMFLMFFVMILFASTTANRWWAQAHLPRSLMDRNQPVSNSGA